MLILPALAQASEPHAVTGIGLLASAKLLHPVTLTGKAPCLLGMLEEPGAVPDRHRMQLVNYEL